MKPERIELSGARDVADVVERVVRERLREVTALAAGLEQRDRRGLHDFRIACKRLRYALERFEQFEPTLESAAEHLALVQDALGEVHDRDVLLAILPPMMGQTQRRLQQEREDCIDRAVEEWKTVRAIFERT
jgi:CHAD domain-containing protein